MITLKDLTTGNELTLGGSIKPIPRKVGFNKVETIYGERKLESIRLLIDLELTIDYLHENDYFNITAMFGQGNGLDIEDGDIGDFYTGYAIDGEYLDLEKKLDIKRKNYYYKGTISLIKVEKEA